MIPDFYTPQAQWSDEIEAIVELIGRVGAIEDLSASVPKLRRDNRLASVHSSTAIEGNTLTLAQVEGLADGLQVFAAPREISEVENALAAYEMLEQFDPWNVDDFLRAHSILMAGLIDEPGAFRSVDVEIVNPEGDVLHTGSRATKVPRLIEELLDWGKTSPDHTLIVSSAIHFLIEYIHPFRDGNGRIGRLWQTLILRSWRPIFAWMPTETITQRNQLGYYTALQNSHDPEIDAAEFFSFMLGVIHESVMYYEEQIRHERASVGINGGLSVGINSQIVGLLRGNGRLTASDLAQLLNKSQRTIERHLHDLVSSGRLIREGSRKTGQWVVLETEGKDENDDQ